MTSKNILNMIF